MINTTRNSILLLYRLIDHKHRNLLYGVFGLSLISAGLEIISLGLIYRFIQLLIEGVDKHRSNTDWYLYRWMEGTNGFAILAAIVFVTVISSGLVRLGNLRFSYWVGAKIGTTISSRCFSKLIDQPYSYHLKTNSSFTISAMTAHIDKTVLSINCAIQLFVSSIISIATITGLFLINSLAAFLAAALVGVFYLAVIVKYKKRLLKSSFNIVSNNKERIKILQESLGGIRDLIMCDTQYFYSQRYSSTDSNQRYLAALNKYYTLFPRFALEMMGMLAILVITIFFHVFSSENVLPVIGTIAFGCQKLIPSLQQSYSSWASIKSFTSDVFEVSSIYSLSSKVKRTDSSLLKSNVQVKKHIDTAFRELIFDNISFSYDSSLPNVFTDLDLKILLGYKYAIIGESGTGKSTLMDLILGLIYPTSGRILLDSNNLHNPNCSNLKQWRQMISYVPQNIYLADLSFTENIALGIPANQINHAQIEEAAKNALCTNFIKKTKYSFSTCVGENGIQLSGGQRQRLGIARAFYTNRKILFLDEATNALDSKTESHILNMAKEQTNTTIFSITHRLSTLSNYDFVIRVSSNHVSVDKV